MKIFGKILVCMMLVASFVLPSSAFWWWGKDKTETIEDFSRQVVGEPLPFSVEDFQGKLGLVRLEIVELPELEFGSIYIGNEPLKVSEIIEITAISGMKYVPTSAIGETSFVLLPYFEDGTVGEEITVKLYQLEVPNGAPFAKDMNLYTYENVEMTDYFDVFDSEGDILTFQITAPSARGGVTLAEDGSSRFIYTPYENKTGNDSFRYTVTDAVGNVSNEGTVNIRINKPSTTVTYLDMEGHEAHKSAIRLAEEGIFVGESIGSAHLFAPDTPVTRDEFLSLTMAITGLEPLPEVESTGFYDDESIPTWAKGYVSAALLAGVIQGSWDEQGRSVFQAGQVITQGEANVILDQLLVIHEVEMSENDHFSAQATANLLEAGVSFSGSLPVSTGLTRGEVAQLLDEALEVVSAQNKRLFFW